MSKECECAAHSAAECCCGAWDEPLQRQPVIDESAAKRIATTLGWEPKRQPLTDEQIQTIERGIWKPEFFDEVEIQANREFARAIEAAHGIKGEA
jgi:hypothetical protein